MNGHTVPGTWVDEYDAAHLDELAASRQHHYDTAADVIRSAELKARERDAAEQAERRVLEQRAEQEALAVKQTADRLGLTVAEVRAQLDTFAATQPNGTIPPLMNRAQRRAARRRKW